MSDSGQAQRGYEEYYLRVNPPDAGSYARKARGYSRRFTRLLDLLEHIQRDEVVELLTKVRGALNEGGFAIVRTPNMNCLQAVGMFCCDWTHVTAFTEGTLFDVAQLAGFSRVEFCNQFRMQNFKGKVRACINVAVVPVLMWLRSGKKVKVYYRNLVAQLFK